MPLWKILLIFLLNFFWHFFFKIKEFLTEFFFQLIILARWQRFATKKITISTHQLSTRWFRNLQWKWASKVVGGSSSSFFDLD